MVTRRDIEAEAAWIMSLIAEARMKKPSRLEDAKEMFPEMFGLDTERHAMTDTELAQSIQRGHCPDCNHRGFLLGPRGGAAQNIECANLSCRARFNVTVFGWQIIMADRIPREFES